MTPADTAAPPARRRRRFVLIVLGGILLAGAGVFVSALIYRNLANERLLRDAIAEVEAVDPHWRLEAVEAGRAAVPDDENSAIVIQNARSLVRQSAAARRWAQWREHVSPEIRLTDEQYQDVTEMLAADDAGIDLALSLARYPRGRFPISYSVDGISTKMLQIADLGAVGPGMLQPLLFARIHGGDASGALTACHALLNLGRSLGDEPFMVSQGIRQHRVGEAIRGVQRLLGQCEVPEVELAAFQAALGQEVDYDPWEIGLRGERAMMFRALEAAQRREVNSFALRVLANSPRRSATALEQVRDWLDERVGQDTRPAAAWSLRYCNRLLQAARLPWPGRRAAIETIEAELAPAPELVGYLVMRVHEAAGHFQSTQARGRCAVAALAAERYRLRHGTWPESLAALVPELLPAVSADPFDGRPLRYRKLADGVVIYSVAEDGTDDGGKLNDSHPPPPGTDVGFRLWDVPHRRQLPPETPR